MGDDYLQGSHGHDTYLVNFNEGDDRAFEWGNYTNDTVVFGAGITLADLSAVDTDTDGNGHRDLTISMAGRSGSFTIEAIFRQDFWVHDSQIDWFEFEDGTRLSHEQFFDEVLIV